ncbi:J domain-containing protein [Paenibacillus radicis (ex Gao et al. 2016)]|uniref:J domain-containing protein n=1 Tax=Paenibacillus radicis (ex Gao et al. 2016) TaxID=1737354 RepID=A0A917HLW8_9BACL|nr:J domain-containing protein [Paenibacillus radicis (ex Gao et al. 2016)]GGG82664.1 hypothetical protein GCM10010918_45130 [Paenibacillus radicis (ex Gao et al. 2016)]
MNELQQAYQTMGLPEHASKDEVEKRYTILMRQERSRQKQQDAMRSAEAPGSETAKVQTGTPDFETVTRAYRFILEYEDKVAAEQFNAQEYGKYKNMAGTAQKVDHFWRYYKFHVFGGIALIALIIYAVTLYIDHREEQARLASLPPVDLSVMYIGEFYMNSDDNKTGTEEQIENALLAQFPDWKRFKVNFTYVAMEAKDQMDMASQQKAMVMLATEKPDIYILDKATFNWIAPQGAFLNLDDIASGLVKDTFQTDAAFKYKTEEDTAEHVYGIDISSSPLIKNIPVLAKDNFIVGVRVTSDKSEKALAFIEHFLAAK